MFVTPARMVLLAPHILLATAEAFAPILDQEMPKWGVSDLLRRAHFLGQACWESAYFSRFSEDLDYTHAAMIAAVFPHLETRAAALVGNPVALANAAYAGRNGNGSEASGDGWLFRGRGIFDLSGRANYKDAGKALCVDFVAQPDLVAQPEYAVKTALWFWQLHGCNELADMNDYEAVTQKINGRAMLGLSRREDLTDQAKAIFI